MSEFWIGLDHFDDPDDFVLDLSLDTADLFIHLPQLRIVGYLSLLEIVVVSLAFFAHTD